MPADEPMGMRFARPLALVVALTVVCACEGTRTILPPKARPTQVGGFIRPPTTTPSARPTAAPTTSARPTAAPSPTAVPIALRFRVTQEGFSPYQLRTYAGTWIELTNADDEPRGIRADDGSFGSGLLDPGERWLYRPTKPGRYGFADPSRPFIIGSLEVVAR